MKKFFIKNTKTDFLDPTYEGGDAWVPGECCTNQCKHDTRTPGLFKVEFEGIGMVTLNLNTYDC